MPHTAPFHKLKTTFNKGFQPPTRWELFLAATMLHCLEAPKQRLELTIPCVTAITEFSLLGLVDQGSPNFLKLRPTSCVPINAKGYWFDTQLLK